MKFQAVAINLIIIVIMVDSAQADIITVGPGTGYDYNTIQSAINIATDGDTVVVAPGIYKGAGNKNIDFAGRLITVRSENGPEETIIDCENNGRGFHFHWGETNDARVEGFTIRNGNTDWVGGAIWCEGSSPVITNSIMIGNRAYRAGGAVCLWNSNSEITNCVVNKNHTDYDGGAFYCMLGTNASILNCTITGNTASRVTGGIHSFNGAIVRITNCILWDNPSEEISLEREGKAVVSFSDIKGGWPGEGNIDVNPLFMDPNSSDFRLRPGSPCIDTGTDAGVSHDIDGMPRPIGARLDMGAYEMPGFLMSPQALELYTNTSTTGSVTLQPVQAYPVSADVIIADPCHVIDSYTNSLVFPDGGATAQTLQISSTDVFGDAVLTISDINVGSDLHDAQFPVYVHPRLLLPALITGINDPNNATRLYFRTVYPVDVPGPVDISVTVEGPVQLIYESGDEDIHSGQYSDAIRIVPTGQTGEAIIRFEVANYDQSGFLFLFDEVEVLASEDRVNHRFYVDSENGSDDNSGLNENNAFATIQRGIDAAGDFDEVIVLPGTYTGDGNRDLDFHGKAITVRSLNGPEDCIIDSQASREDIHQGFYFHSGEDANSIVAGFTIINGNMYGMDGGSAIACRDSSPTIMNCHILKNSAPWGGGIYLWNSYSEILDCIISYNTAGGRGGGIYCREGIPKIKRCIISNNDSGIRAEYSDVEITLCEIKSNTGGGVSLGVSGNGWSTPLLKDCLITNNTRNGGVRVYCNATIEGCIIAQNENIGSGGGIYSHKRSPLIINNIICENSARWGGGLYLRESTPRILNNVIANNIGTGLHGYRVPGCTISNNTIIGNNHGNLRFESPSTPELSNNIIANASSKAGIEFDEPGIINMQYNNVYNNAGVNYKGLEDQTGINGNISVDPGFSMSATNGYQYHLLATSSCINAGDPNTAVEANELDIDGESRVVNGRIDIGADEFLDTDSDSLPDWWESEFFGSVVAAHPKNDNDDDKLKNDREYLYGTNPFNSDIDNDGRNDADELDDGTDPYNVDNPERTYYVSVSEGNDLYDGLYRTVTEPDHGPKKTIQAAVDLASKSCVYTVLVADGAYTGEGNKGISFDGKTIVLRSEDSDPNAVIIDCEENGRAFYLNRGETDNCRIDGFSIINGMTTDIGGSGVRMHHSGATISNCIFRNHSATSQGDGQGLGGAVCSTESSCQILDCTFQGNYGGDGAGAIYCSGTKSLIRNCLITENNTGGSGGGVILGGDEAQVLDCTITGNSAGHSGGLLCSGNDTKISNCEITYNHAREGLAALEAYNTTGLTVEQCNISFNSGGGGLRFSGYLWYQSPCIATVQNCTVTNNSGTGISLIKADVDILNCTIADNIAQLYGGGIFAEWSCYSDIVNCILWGNSATYGTQIAGRGDQPRLTLSYCDVEGGESFESIYREELYVVDWGNGNLEVDPLFVNSIGGDYRLPEESPCIDAGADSEIYVDIEGNKRPFDYPSVDNNGDLPDYDMGAYELILPPMEVSMKVKPRVLNLSSRGKWVKVHFILPEGFSIDDVDADTPVTLEPLGITSDKINVFINSNGYVEVKAAFERSAFCNSGASGPTIEITCTGLLTSGQSFYGTSTIKKIHYDSFEYLAGLTSYWLDESCSPPDWCVGFDLNHDLVVNFIDFATFNGCCIEVIKKR